MSQGLPILNVDDHAPARFVRTRILQRAGFGVQEAGTAADAIHGAAAASLLLLDVRLPDGDGIDVCEQVKRRRPDLPVVMITSVYRTAQARRDAFTAGADAFLLEPVDPAQLVRTIQGLMAGPDRRTAAPTREAAEAWIVTDAAGHILEISPAAAKLLNLTVRGARGRNLPAFVVADRPQVLGDLLRASEGTIVQRQATLQPRDRRPQRVTLDLSALDAAPGEGASVRWVLTEES